MCACRLEEARSAASGYDLEDYIFEMENRNNFQQAKSENGDLYTQLDQKENDLILAAQLGKALLERNEELKKSHESLKDRYQYSLEQLEQEKYSLRRKLDSLEEEYQSKVFDLQSDIKSLQMELEDRHMVEKYSERERVNLVQELTDQNTRLTEQLKNSSYIEEQLVNQLKILRDQFHTRRSSFSGHVDQLELLREEIKIISDKKCDLERRIEALVEERDGISLTLDESTDRILFLEKTTRDQELKIRHQERDLEELRQINGHLQERLEVVSRRSSTPASLAHTSLLNEIEMSEDDGNQGSHFLHSHSSPISANEIEEEDIDDIECDSPSSHEIGHNSKIDDEELTKLKEEVLDAFIHIKNLCMQIKQRRGSISTDSSSSEEMNVNSVKVGMLTESLKLLKGLLRDILRRNAKGPCTACGRSSTSDKEDLEKEVNRELQRLLNTEVSKYKQKCDDVYGLTGKLDMMQIELRNLKEERDMLKNDLANTSLSKDEVIKNAWEIRDKALTRKNTVEVELARTRIDIMHINSQLIEAIQQKLELSQQLEMWQVDMHALLDSQIKKKLNQIEQDSNEESDGNNTTGSSGIGSASSKPKRFSLWK